MPSCVMGSMRLRDCRIEVHQDTRIALSKSKQGWTAPTLSTAVLNRRKKRPSCKSICINFHDHESVRSNTAVKVPKTVLYGCIPSAKKKLNQYAEYSRVWLADVRYTAWVKAIMILTTRSQKQWFLRRGGRLLRRPALHLHPSVPKQCAL